MEFRRLSWGSALPFRGILLTTECEGRSWRRKDRHAGRGEPWKVLAYLCLFVAMVGFFLLPIGLWRILAGAFSGDRRAQRAKSGMRMLSVGVGLLVTGSLSLAACAPPWGY